MCTIVFSKVQLSKTSNLLCLRRPIPAMHSIYCLLRLWRKDKSGTIVFPKAQPRKHCMCCVFQHPAQQSMPFPMISKASPTETLYLPSSPVCSKSSSSIHHFRLRFRRPSPPKYSIYSILRFQRKDKCGTIVFSKAQPTTLLHLLYFRSLGLCV